MDVKVTFVIVCLCALAIASIEAGIPKCCITTQETIPVRVLRRVRKWEMQEGTGPCDISALRLYVKDNPKPICAHPSMRKRLSRRHTKMGHYKQQVTN